MDRKVIFSTQPNKASPVINEIEEIVPWLDSSTGPQRKIKDCIEGESGMMKNF